MPGFRFPKSARLLCGEDFERVFARKRSASDAVLVVYACENTLGTTRLGLAVSRKVGGAVQRNRWKRLIREAFRLNRVELPEGLDLIVLPKSAGKPSLAEAV
jgi:ribonuclease P protein component